jgi:F0F1-type ATP synthase membrane subunit b/b'
VTEFINLLSSLPIGGISFGGLVTLAIILIFKGEIVPKSTLEAMRTDRDAIIEAKNEENTMLKEAYKLSEQARATGAEADKELLELGRTTVHLLESIHERANGVVI